MNKRYQQAIHQVNNIQLLSKPILAACHAALAVEWQMPMPQHVCLPANSTISGQESIPE
jgi:hypothetical protein